MIDRIQITEAEVQKLLALEEGHFSDLKSVSISPAKLTRSISAFSNAEGGELYIGIEDAPRIWSGFESQEAANGHIQALDGLFPLGDGYSYQFLEYAGEAGFVLKVDVDKSRTIRTASNGKVYLRRGAQNIPISDAEALKRLERNKGINSFEIETVNVEPEVIENSVHILDFLMNVVPSSEPLPWLKKQRLIVDEKPTVAGLILFAEEPQSSLPKQCGLKIYQYSTKEEGVREELMFNPLSIEGNAYELIEKALTETVGLVEAIRIMTADGLKNANYPREALHEIITNAVLHRDYSLADDIHVRVYDNRIEVQSPGTLPAHITPENILDERFARNGVLVRLINKFPNPPNKDVGEGLNTAFNAMRTMRLKDPVIEQRGTNVVVTLRHESLGTPQELIMQFLENHDRITNREAREICNVGSENAMKHILKRMVEAEMLEVLQGETRFQTAYRKKNADT